MPKFPSVDRVWLPWDVWECYPAGFFASLPPPGLTPDEAREMYTVFFSDLDLFNHGIDRVFEEWPCSCLHFLTNPSFNRVAWLGQAAACIVLGVPCKFRAGFRDLSPEQQREANQLAERRIKDYLIETFGT